MTTRLTFGLAALAGLGLALGGCGSSSGGGSSNSAQLTFDGTGTELEGYWVAEVTESTGFYATEHYAIKGWTQGVYIYDTGVNDVSFDGSTLSPDPATKTYVGNQSYNLTDGAFDSFNVDEIATMSFSGGTVKVKVTGTSNAQTGSYSITLHPVYGADVFDQDSNDYYGRTTKFSGGSSKINGPYVGGTNIVELYDWGPGTYGYMYMDGSYNWSDYIYVDSFYLSGNTLKGGGYYEGNYINDSNGWIGDAPGGFATVSIPLSAGGQPTSVSYAFMDYETGVTINVAANDFRTSEKYYARYQNLYSWRNITVSTVTSGGVLETRFGVPTTVVASGYYDGAYYTGLSAPTGNDVWSYGGMVGTTQRRVEIWEGRYYEFNGTGEAGYELDAFTNTPERHVVTINNNADGLATDGTLQVTFYDVNYNATSTETMTFVIAP